MTTPRDPPPFLSFTLPRTGTGRIPSIPRVRSSVEDPNSLGWVRSFLRGRTEARPEDGRLTLGPTPRLRYTGVTLRPRRSTLPSGDLTTPPTHPTPRTPNGRRSSVVGADGVCRGTGPRPGPVCGRVSVSTHFPPSSSPPPSPAVRRHPDQRVLDEPMCVTIHSNSLCLTCERGWDGERIQVESYLSSLRSVRLLVGI